MEKIDFTNKVVIVTGASSGIGAEIAKLLAAHNAKLTLVGRNDVRLTKVAEECHSEKGLQPLCLLLDLTVDSNCEATVDKTVETYGQLDVLINCAGKVRVSSLFDRTMDTFDEIIAINLRTPYLLTQLSLPHLLKTKGNVVNIGSSLSKRHRPGFLAYMISKSGLDKLTQQAAAELAYEGVKVNSISPGITRTNILDNFNVHNDFMPIVYDLIAENQPQRTVIEPKEVAQMVVLTASGIFPHLNGSNFVVDGAASMS